MRIIILLLLIGLFSFGCIFPPPDGNATINTTTNTTMNATNNTTNATNYSNLKSIVQLKTEFNCDLEVQNETKINNLVVWTCARQYSYDDSDEEGIYMVDAHPMGAWVVTYLVYDGMNYVEVKKSDQLTQFFTPIESENEALTYTYLYKGLNMVQSVSGAPLSGSTNAQKSGNIFVVTILYEDWSMCPCYGSYWKTVYDVTSNGTITEKTDEYVYGFQDNCVC
ncbi:MAG: hypothetical protein ABH842_05675 [Candidatus Micrarchaeota archaeon]